MAVPSDGTLRRGGGAHLLASRAPARAASGQIVEGLELSDFSREKIDATNAELAEERDAVRGLGLV